MNLHENGKCNGVEDISCCWLNGKKRKMDTTEEVTQSLGYSNSRIGMFMY